MLPRIDALSRDVHKIKDDGVIEELKTDVQKLRYKLDGHAEDVSRIMVRKLFYDFITDLEY